jgi:hypothetical protein
MSMSMRRVRVSLRCRTRVVRSVVGVHRAHRRPREHGGRTVHTMLNKLVNSVSRVKQSVVGKHLQLRKAECNPRGPRD